MWSNTFFCAIFLLINFCGVSNDPIILVTTISLPMKLWYYIPFQLYAYTIHLKFIQWKINLNALIKFNENYAFISIVCARRRHYFLKRVFFNFQSFENYSVWHHWTVTKLPHCIENGKSGRELVKWSECCTCLIQLLI